MSTNDLPALSRCPFCNGDAEFSETGHPLDNDYFTVVGCTECSALVTNGWGDTPEEARRAAAGEWNRRHERTCRNVSAEPDMFQCSECGFSCDFGLSYCGGCGARVVVE